MITNTTTAETEDNSKDFKLIKKYINKNTVALDIGACIGNFTKFLAENCKKVHAFEPSNSNFSRLRENTKDFDNVKLYHTAVGNVSNCDSTLYLCPNDIGMNRLYNSEWCKEGKIENVIQVKIDDMPLTDYEDKINFVKIDVEGYEYFVIKGMKQLLERDHPTIMIEWHPLSMEEAKGNPEHLHYLLRYTLGYNDPINCNTGDIITSYYELDKQTRRNSAVNIIFT